MFLNTFHREHILLKLKIKKLLRKIKSKNLTAGVFFFNIDERGKKSIETVISIAICGQYFINFIDVFDFNLSGVI